MEKYLSHIEFRTDGVIERPLQVSYVEEEVHFPKMGSIVAHSNINTPEEVYEMKHFYKYGVLEDFWEPHLSYDTFPKENEVFIQTHKFTGRIRECRSIYRHKVYFKDILTEK